MALNETYNLTIHGDGSQLNKELDTLLNKLKYIDSQDVSKPLKDYYDKIQHVQSAYKDLNKVMDKNKDKTLLSSNDLNKSLNLTRDITKHISDLQGAMKEVEKVSLSKGLKTDFQALHQVMNGLEGTYKSVINQQKEMNSMRVGTDTGVKELQKEWERLGQEPKEYLDLIKKVNKSKLNTSSVTRTHNRAKSSMERADRDGRYSAKDGSEVANTLNRSSRHFKDQLKENKKEQRNLNKEAEKYKETIESIKNDYSSGKISKGDYVSRVAKEDKIQQGRDTYKKQLEVERRKLQQAEKALGENGTIRNHFNDSKVAYSRDTIQGQIAERSPSIASHAVMATTGALGLQYAQGKSASQSIRPELIALGQQTGASDYTALRKNLFEASDAKGLGFKPTELVEMSSRAMQAMGDKGLPNNEEITTQLATGARGLGIANTESYLNSMESVMHSGAISNDTDLREFQNTVSGGIKDSGMTAQADEQLKALANMTDTMGANRELSKDDLNTITGMQGIFAESGSKSLQGEKGANALNQLQQGFKNAQQDPFLRNITGFGTEYTGITGAWQQQKDLADPSNLGKNLDKVFSVYGTDTESGEAMTGLTLTNQFGLDPQQAQEIIDMYNENGGFDEEIQKKLESYQKDSNMDENVKNQSEQQEGKDNQNEARQEEQSMALYDSIGALRNFQGALAGMNPVIYQTIIALEALVASMTASGAMMAGSYGMKRATGRMAKRGSDMTQPVGTGRRGGTNLGGKRGNRGSKGSDPKKPNGGNNGNNGIIDNSTIGTPFSTFGMMGNWFGGGDDTQQEPTGRQRRQRQRPEGQGQPRPQNIGGDAPNGRLGKLGRGVGEVFSPSRMMGTLGMLPLLLNPPKDKDGSIDYSTIAMMYGQTALMDMAMNGGFGKLKDLGSRGIGKAKNLGQRGKGIYKQKGLKGTFQSTLGKAKGYGNRGKGIMDNINKRISNTRTKGIEHAKGTDWKGIGQNVKNITKQKYGNLSKPKGLSATGSTIGNMTEQAGGLLGKLGGAKGLLKKAGWLGAGISAVDIGSSLIQGDSKGASKKLGDSVGGIIDPLGLGYGKILGDPVENMANKAQSKDAWSWWSNGDSDGKNTFQDSVVGKLLGFGGKDKKDNGMKAGGGGQESSSSNSLLSDNNSSFMGGITGLFGKPNEDSNNRGNNGCYKQHALLVA